MLGKFLARSVQEWAARGGQPYPLDLIHPSAAQALVYRVVLAVDRQQRLALAPRLGGNQFAGGHQAFLVGQPDLLARLHRLVGGFQPGHADNCADHEIDLRVGRHGHGSSRAPHHLGLARTGVAQPLPQSLRRILAGHREQLRTPAQRLFKGELQIRARGQGRNRKALRITFDDFEGAATNRTGRAQNCDSFHHDTYQFNPPAYPCTNFCPKARNRTNATGSASSSASIRSRIPPCPGSIVPESFTPAPRFSADSSKSPTCAATLMTTASRAASQSGARP